MSSPFPDYVGSFALRVTFDQCLHFFLLIVIVSLISVPWQFSVRAVIVVQLWIHIALLNYQIQC